MLTSAHAAQARRFAASPRGGFSVTAVDQLTERVFTTLQSYERTGTPGPGGLTADTLGHIVLPSVIAEPGYGMLEVQDFLDEAHEALATFEQRAAVPVQHPWATPAAPTAQPAQTTWVPGGDASVAPERPVPSVPLPTNVAPAIRALAAVGGRPRQEGHFAPAVEPARPAAAPAAAPSPSPAPDRAYGMDADALLFELQQAIAQSRSRGSLQVSVQVPGQQLRVMRVVETAPGNITIVAR